jgi:hypothetical protein
MPFGPTAFAVSLLLCALAFLLFVAGAVRQRSLATAGGAVLVAAFGALLLFASIGFTIPGCSGI